MKSNKIFYLVVSIGLNSAFLDALTVKNNTNKSILVKVAGKKNEKGLSNDMWWDSATISPGGSDDKLDPKEDIFPYHTIIVTPQDDPNKNTYWSGQLKNNDKIEINSTDDPKKLSIVVLN